MITKCTRCKRSLKNIQYIDGAPYGPVCFVKMGGSPAPSGNAKRTRKGPVVDAGQEKLFGLTKEQIENAITAIEVARMKA